MRSKKGHLSEAEHDEIGLRLSEMDQYLVRLCCTIPNTYGKTVKASNLASRALEAISKLKCELEEHYFEDCPETARFSVYYRRNMTSKPLRESILQDEQFN